MAAGAKANECSAASALMVLACVAAARETGVGPTGMAALLAVALLVYGVALALCRASQG